MWDSDELNEEMGSFNYSDIPDGESSGIFFSTPGECIYVVTCLCSYVDSLEQPPFHFHHSITLFRDSFLFPVILEQLKPTSQDEKNFCQFQTSDS
jgi:hypothetical protein